MGKRIQGISLSGHLKAAYHVDRKAFSSTGSFDPNLVKDSPFFIDPTLLDGCKEPEFLNSRQAVHTHFDKILNLIALSEKVGDRAWREAKKMLIFPEVASMGLGYSKSSTRGRGLGEKIADTLLETISLLVDSGIRDPNVFELLGLFEPGVGTDLISDMIGNILLPNFEKYSHRVFNTLKVQLVPHKGKLIFPHPMDERIPLLLVPRDILSDLPIAHDFSDIERVVFENEELRRRFNEILGKRWKELFNNAPKREIKKVLIEHPGILKELLETYHSKSGTKYDFTSDPKGLINWQIAAEDIISRFPLQLSFKILPHLTRKNVYKLVCELAEHFKQIIESNGLWRNFYADRGTFANPLHESYGQNLFFSTAYLYCQQKNIDISPETDAGTGPIDFKFSRGTREKVLVELKLSTNARLAHAYTKQVPIYQKSNRTTDSIIVVVIVSQKESYLEKLEEEMKRSPNGPKVIFIDALQKKSASTA